MNNKKENIYNIKYCMKKRHNVKKVFLKKILMIRKKNTYFLEECAFFGRWKKAITMFQKTFYIFLNDVL